MALLGLFLLYRREVVRVRPSEKSIGECALVKILEDLTVLV